MADYGFIAKNDGNEIQIDSKYRNFSCFDSGSLSISGWINTVDFVNVTEIPIIGIRPSPNLYCTWSGLSKDVSNNYVSGEIYGEENLTGTIQWIAFLEGIYNALPTYGLVIKNPSDEVCFSSNESYFKVKGVYSVTSASFGGVNVTVQNADTNYFLLYPFSWWIRSAPLDGGLWEAETILLGMRKVSSTVISVALYITLTEETDEDPYHDAIHSNHLLIEVGI